VAERLAQSTGVGPGDLREPVADAPVDVEASLVRKLANGCAADQVVHEPDRSAGLDDDPTRDELGRGVLRALDWPFFEFPGVREG
jgi:hypothetical protein